MLNIKKVICIVSILLVSVFCLSIVVRTTSIGTAGPNNENGYSGIGLPDNGVEIINRAAPITGFTLSQGGQGSTLAYYNYGDYSLISGASTSDRSFFRCNFASDSSSYTGINLSDYFYYKVEFDILKQSNIDPCTFSVYLIARSPSGVGAKLEPSEFTIKYNQNDSKMELTYGEHVVKDDSFHIEYVIEAYPLDLNKSRIQFFVNGKLIPETKYNEIVNFKYDLYYFSELRFWKFGESEGNIVVKDLKVTGYAKE